MLQYLSDHHPEYIGLIVYLFVFGELVDAYQNRHIPHSERLKIVLRARYFIDCWLAFLAAGQYPITGATQYCLSREALDITRILIEGYIILMYIHRDCLSDCFEDPIPFLPWLHSSEACEHVFGDARNIVSDFTMLDFIYFIPKLSVTLRKAANRAISTSDAKAKATGYNHTYFNCDGRLDLLVLATFPNDSEIGEIAQAAAEEVDSLINLLGIDPACLRHLKRLGLQTTTMLPLASIDTWFPADSEELELDTEDDKTEQEVLQEILEHETDHTLSRTRKQDEAVERLSYAAAVLVAEDMEKM